MNDLTLLLCDRETEYAHQMSEYLLRQQGISWKVRTYTDPSELLRQENSWKDSRQEGNILLLAENAYEEGLASFQVNCLVVLEENGRGHLRDCPHICKYQSADEVIRQLLEIYAEKVQDFSWDGIGSKVAGSIIGFYSPVHRCLQTTLAFALSLKLAEKGRTLYLSLEYYGGIREIWSGSQSRDLGDLLYFLHEEGDKFHLRLQSMLQHYGDLDYILPMKVGENLLSVTAGEWLSLLDKLSGECGYDYLVLDLSENVQGLFQILRSCKKVITIGKVDSMASMKQNRYEEMLQLYHFQDVLDKTRRITLPRISRVPEVLEEYGNSELQDYVKELLAELEKEGG